MAERGDADVTRAALLRSARIRFALYPYADVTLRDIAADIGVSAALVIKYFGCKDDLLREVVAFDDIFQRFLAGPLEGLGEHLVRSLLEHTAAPDAVDPFVASVLVAVGKQGPDWARDELVRRFVDVLADRLTGSDTRLRAELVCGYLVGVSAMRRVVEAEPLASTAPDELSARVGPVLQALIDG
jgi:AcrR family transcriptional regulator